MKKFFRERRFLAVTLCMIAFYVLCCVPLLLPSPDFLVTLSRGIVKPAFMIVATIIGAIVEITKLAIEHPLGTMLFVILVFLWVQSYDD